MKKIITIACMLAGISAYAADGTVNFNNRVTSDTPPIDAPVFWVDGTTKLAGPQYLAQLYAGSVATSLTAVGNTIPFRTGAGAGYFNTTGVDTARTIPGVEAGTAAFIQVRAWDTSAGPTYEAALAAGGAAGISSTLSITTGNAGQPASLPANLTGLQSFSLTQSAVPEPSTLALGLLGAALLVIRRRK